MKKFVHPALFSLAVTYMPVLFVVGFSFRMIKTAVEVSMIIYIPNIRRSRDISFLC